MEPLDGVDAAAAPVDSNAGAVDNGGGQQPTGENPAWAELLGVLPSSLHGQVKPFLEKWDRGVNDRFTKVQSEYEPYKNFVGTDPEQIQASLKLAELIATDPRSFYDNMTQYYADDWGLNQDQGQGADDADDYSLDGFEDEDDQGLDLESNPLIQQLKSQQDTIANFLAAELEQKRQAEEAKAVEEAGTQIQTEISGLAQKYQMESLPVEAERMILSLAMQNNLTLEQAGDQVLPLFKAQSRTPLPKVISPGGGVPSANLDTAKLSPADTRALVTRMLEEAARNG